MPNHKVKKSEIDQRLDIFLIKELNLSRSQIQKLIKEGLILVNDKKIKTHYLLKEGDEISIIKTSKDRPVRQARKQKLPQFKVIVETKDYLIINKPAGLAVHGGENINEPTLADVLEKKYTSLRKVGDDPKRPGIVHRLDKDASGLMVIAKNNKMFEHLKKQFQKRQIKKEYTALVYGKINREHDEINFPISRSVQGFKMAAHPQKPTFAPTGSELRRGKQGGKTAITEFEVLKKFINYTLIKVKTKTGRPHQVRVHLSAYGHPLAGDNLYGTKKTRGQNQKLRLSRVFLHADYLGFYNLRNRLQEFRINLPTKLKKILREIK